MPSVLDTLITGFATDTVAVFTQDFTQVFAHARPIKATVKPEARLMEHPAENGIVLIDHRVLLPIEIELSLVLARADYPDTYKTIVSYYNNATLLVVQTRSAVYQNQLIAALPHEEDPEQYDVLTVALKLKQVQFVNARFGVVPKSAVNTTTVQRGTQQTMPTPPSFPVQQLGLRGRP